MTSAIVILSIGLTVTNITYWTTENDKITIDDLLIKTMKSQGVYINALSEGQNTLSGIIEGLLLQNDQILWILENKCNDIPFEEIPKKYDVFNTHQNNIQSLNT